MGNKSTKNTNRACFIDDLCAYLSFFSDKLAYSRFFAKNTIKRRFFIAKMAVQFVNKVIFNTNQLVAISLKVGKAEVALKGGE